MRTVGVVTVGRSDYGIYRPVLRKIEAAEDLELFLVVAGAHLLTEHGSTVEEIERDGFRIAERVPMLTADDSSSAVALGLGRGVTGFAEVFTRSRVDILLIVGDRLEMLAAVLAALPFTIPIAHVHGGELTQSAVDDGIRHAISKLSHLHFVATEEYAERLAQMGEERWRIVVSGAPALDAARDGRSSQAPGVEEPFVLVTWHPVTLEPDEADEQMEELFAALANVDASLVITHPNADPGRSAIVERIQRLADERSGVHVFPSLGSDRYFALMRRARVLVGNSSSGIVEAASFGLPVVNVGNRQLGRVRGPNVIDVPPSRQAIAAAIERAVSDDFRSELAGLVNPYGDGNAADRIVERLRTVALDRRLIVKRFEDAA